MINDFFGEKSSADIFKGPKLEGFEPPQTLNTG